MDFFPLLIETKTRKCRNVCFSQKERRERVYRRDVITTKWISDNSRYIILDKPILSFIINYLHHELSGNDICYTQHYYTVVMLGILFGKCGCLSKRILKHCFLTQLLYRKKFQMFQKNDNDFYLYFYFFSLFFLFLSQCFRFS